MKIPIIDNYVKKQIEKETVEYSKGINLEETLMTNPNVHVLGEWHLENPLTENIYNTIANDISLVNYQVVKEKKGSYEHVKKQLENILNLRPNVLQTSTDFWNSFTYNVLKYGNGIALINYDKRGAVKSLNNLDVSEYYFGFGYELRGVEKVPYLLLKAKTNGEVTAIEYNDVIHVRYIPANIFKGDKYKCQSFNNIVEVVDKNINSMIADLSQGGKIKGILKMKTVAGAKENKKQLGKNFWDSVEKGVATIDQLSDFQPLSTEFGKASKEDIDNIMNYVYNMYGVNDKIIKGTFTNAEYVSYYNKTLEPILKRLTDELNWKLLTQEDRNDEVKVKLFKSLLVGASPKEIAAIFDKGIYQGSFTNNEYRKAVGFEPYPQGDQFYSNANAVPVEMIGQQFTNIRNEETGEEVNAEGGDENEERDN